MVDYYLAILMYVPKLICNGLITVVDWRFWKHLRIRTIIPGTEPRLLVRLYKRVVVWLNCHPPTLDFCLYLAS